MDFPPAGGSQRLREWERAPYVRAVRPQEAHFVPLQVVVGAAEQEPAKFIYSEENFLGRIAMSSYQFAK